MNKMPMTNLKSNNNNMCLNQNQTQNINLQKPIEIITNDIYTLIEEEEFKFEYILIGIDSNKNKQALGINYNIDKPDKESILNRVKFSKPTSLSHKAWCKCNCSQNLDDYKLVLKINIKDTDFIVLDFDEKNISYEDILDKYPFLVNCIYTRGTRGLGFHFYMKTKDKDLFGVKKDNAFKDIKGDCLTECVWENSENTLYNDNGNELNQDICKNIFTEEYYNTLYNKIQQTIEDIQNKEKKKENLTAKFTGNIDELEDIENNIPKKYSDQYSDWIKIISIFKKYNLYDLAKTFSKKSKKYNDKDFDDFYFNKTTYSNFDIGTIYFYSKENKTQYEKIKKKYKEKEIKKFNDENQSYQELEDSFQKTHFKVINKKTFVKITKDEIIYFKIPEFKQTYEHLCYDAMDKEGNICSLNFISKYTTNNKNMRQYQDIDIYPNSIDCPKHHYNLWKPFDIELLQDYQEDIDGLKYILNHIKILCNHQEDVYEYLLDWISHLFKMPSQKPGKFILFASKQGTGKGQFCKLLSYMLGQKKYLETSMPERDVWGDFNSAMSESYLVSIEELEFLQTKKSEGTFKSYITQPRIPINSKGKDLLRLKSYHRFIGSTNNLDCPIKTEKDDRRNLIIRCSDEKIGDFKYFEKLETYINSKNTQKTFYNFLMERKDIDLFMSKKIPITQYQTSLKESYEDIIYEFLRLYLDNNLNKKSTKISQKDLYKDYIEFIKSEGCNYEITTKRFAMKVCNLNFASFHKYRTSACMMYEIDIEQLGKDLNTNTTYIKSESESELESESEK